MKNKQTGKKVVVTGGAGFIGSHIVDKLIDLGHEVHVVDNLRSGKRENINKNATLHEVDIRETNKLLPIFEDTACVYHEAAIPGVTYAIEYPLETHDTNVNGTLSVLEAAREAGVKRVIYAASGSAYGEHESMPLSEDLSAMPMHPYGLQKYMGELYCKVYSDVYNLETVCLRYFNVYGPRLDPDGDYALVIGKFLKQKKNKEPLTIVGDGEITRDFTHVSDIAQANILALEAEKVGKGDIINIGAGVETTVNALAAMFGGEKKTLPARRKSVV